MSTAHADAEVIHLSDRLATRTDLTKSTDPAPAPAPAIVERRGWRDRSAPAVAVARTTAHGAATLAARVWDYEQAGEYGRRIADARRREAAGVLPVDDAEELVALLRRERREVQEARHVEPRTIWGATGATTTATLLTLLATSTPLGAVALLGVLGGGLYGYGRHVLRQREEVNPHSGGQASGSSRSEGQAEVIQGEVVGAPEQGLDQQEFHIDMPAETFKAMVSQALTEDLNVNIKSVRVIPHVWGFAVDLHLSRMTPAVISNGLDVLEACLPGVRTASILLQQSQQSRNQCVLRVPGPNPWRSVPELPYRAPKSLRTSEIHKQPIGADMSGLPLCLPVNRTNVNLVGKSRSGKSTVLQAELDVLTATEDQIVIGIDLGSAGAGFGGLRHGMHAVATTPEQASTVLRWALDLGKGRPDLFDDLDMVGNWQTSANRPGIKIVVDEFPALVVASRKGYLDPDSGKRVPWGLDDALAELAVTSAKSDVTMVIAGQGVTKEVVKDNTWITDLQVQVMCSCDTSDIQQIMAGGAMAMGWRPDRLLPAMGEEINDAGVAYVMAGAQYCEPIPYRASIASNDELTRRGKERAAAGLVKIDQESAELSNVTLDDIIALCWGSKARPRKSAVPDLIAAIRRVFSASDDPAGMTPGEIAEALAERDPSTWAVPQFASEDERVTALQAAIAASLEPVGATWKRDKIQRDGRRDYYRLKDLTALITALEGPS